MSRFLSIMVYEEILYWLRENNEEKLKELWEKADLVRRQFVGDEVYLRGLIEISNYCSKNCSYCGIRVSNKSLKRYRMSKDEIIDTALLAKELGYGTVVLQSGEDPGFLPEEIAYIIGDIKSKAGLAVTLSLGEQSRENLKLWKRAGADRYLLKFETSDERLFKKLHRGPSAKKLAGRISQILYMKELGYEVGSGIIIGLPYQTYESIAKDIVLFKEMDLDMIGIGPYVPHPLTPLGKIYSSHKESVSKSVPNTPEMTIKVVALTRLACPESNIPATTALATIGGVEARKLCLLRGANIIMPNITPLKYRVYYDIYPGKTCSIKNIQDTHEDIIQLIESIGRIPGVGRGDRVRQN
ncbi:MAG: [FeFe] hydrogenase H-cluster radical SAM maturase HydE [Candidatus Hydrogenedentes bacterium]|nr:[FeFe] hydrogenase H-cluster radical SAM maturase HydE [Candidatus Hydrogenedentota bacterium]